MSESHDASRAELGDETVPAVLVSTVTPVYQGQDSLPELAARLADVRRRWRDGGFPFALAEAIFVDDASIDDSAAVLAGLESEHDFVRVVTLSRNFGQHPATAAGILHSSGDWVVTLDEDLQHRPEDVERLLERAVVERLDVVYARPAGQVHRAWYRDLTSRTYKSLLSFATGDQNVRSFNSFRAVRGAVARGAAAVVGHDTFLDIALGWFTQRVGEREVTLRDERETSGYTLLKLFSHARRAIVSSQTKWLRLGAGVGIGGLTLGLILLLVILVQKLIAPDTIEVRGWTSLFLTVVFFGGLASFLIGVALEYLSTLLLAAHGKPTFFVVDRSLDEIPRQFFIRAARPVEEERQDDADLEPGEPGR